MRRHNTRSARVVEREFYETNSISISQQSINPNERPEHNFGVLKGRPFKKLKQSQAVIITEKDRHSDNFGRLDGEELIKIIQSLDINRMRALSRWFARVNGIYNRTVRYLAELYRYDFIVYPNLDLDIEITDEMKKKLLKKFNNILEYFDNSAIQLMCLKWASRVCIDGVYYGYIVDDISNKLVIQDLPIAYCRSRFTHKGLPLVEFNVQYFSKVTQDENYREQLLNLFPEEIRKAYKQYLNNKLKPEYQGDIAGWVILDPQRAFKFNFYDTDLPADIPPFLYAIPSLINLAEVQDLEKEKLLQEIQKILIQEFQLDKQDQIPFTTRELQQLNDNALSMVSGAVGVSVLSTVAKVHLEDLAPERANDSENRINSAESSVYNDLGISQNLFNTEGNLALEKSIITDEAFAKELLLQFEEFFNNYIEWRFNKPKSKYRLKMLNTTIFNNKEMSKTYQDLTKIGFSRFLPMVALGHSQKEVMSMAKMEQQILQLDMFMLAPFSSSTTSTETWLQAKELQDAVAKGETPDLTILQETTVTETSTSNTNNSENDAGRPESPDDEKSAKTIANKESMN